MATSADGTRIAWYRYGGGERTILFVPTWNLVDARVVGHQVAALEPHADVLTYDPRGAGASGRPSSGYTFPLHAADALAVLDATGAGGAAIVTASRGMNAALLLVANDPERFPRLAVVAPYMQLDPEPTPPSPEWVDRVRNDWGGFIVPFMRAVFTEPDSEDVIAEMTEIGFESTPDVVATQETRARLDRARPPSRERRDPDARPPWRRRPARSRRTCREHRRRDAERTARSHPHGGHRPDIRNPELVNPLLLEFLLAT